ncbi:hypothetical protein BCV72DRAFT_310987 [Rhizopus microsporus var. microsporus]|uniref:TLDc domain-containing protein n=1 Tax=Rhizopus microsporus var. microsporus TaxID=86635 RepID=A0A1X0RJG5_RHIZD|nr:hypothetical protein BCV72DRAFT_310987 [Rhizopus microsporus var. microsporus]
MGQSHTKPEIKTSQTFRPSKYLTKVELVSIKCVFNSLKSAFPDHFECIEPKNFLARLALPSEVEPAGVLLFKAFSYLGSYPACTAAGPVPLSLDAFLTAFVVFTGRLGHELSETLFFQALSILPDPVKKKETPVTLEPPKKHGHSKGLSLEDLGVDFTDLDLDIQKKEKDDGPEILCRDLVELFVLLLWLGSNEDHDENRRVATDIVDSLEKTKDDTCVSYRVFSEWKSNFSLHLFNPIQSFITQSFTYIERPSERISQEDTIPVPDQTDLLSHMHCTLLSWSLPEKALNVKKWTRLYSAQQDGFSMNRFESHVFKYPGPTLMVLKIEAQPPKRYSSLSIATETNAKQNMLVGVYVPQTWKNSKYFWGTNECFLFELEPNFDIFRSNERTVNDHYIYYHHDTGIGFGARAEKGFDFTLLLENTLQGGVYENEAYPSSPVWMSFKRRKQDFKYIFETVDVEVFGLGTEKDKEKQLKEWEFERKEAQRRSGLNIRLSDGELDKELLKMAGIIDEDKRQDR